MHVSALGIAAIVAAVAVFYAALWLLGYLTPELENTRERLHDRWHRIPFQWRTRLLTGLTIAILAIALASR